MSKKIDIKNLSKKELEALIEEEGNKLSVLCEKSNKARERVEKTQRLIRDARSQIRALSLEEYNIKKGDFYILEIEEECDSQVLFEILYVTNTNDYSVHYKKYLYTVHDYEYTFKSYDVGCNINSFINIIQDNKYKKSNMDYCLQLVNKALGIGE